MNNTVQPANNPSFDAFRQKMQEKNTHPSVIKLFEIFYNKLVSGEKGFIPGSQAGPVENLHNIDELEKYKELGIKSLDNTVVIKLNGGLGTSMGLQGAKTLLEAKDGYKFIDVIVKQIIETKKKYNTRTPVLFMNSFRTIEDTKKALEAHPELEQDIPTSFFENKVPKIMKSDLSPAHWPKDPSNEWAPPGHGDLYPALLITGMLDELIEKGYKYAFVSNADNLGAVADPRIAGYMEQTNAPFLMEVTRRTVNDKKGGHLAKTPEGQLILREVAQCPEDEIPDFQDITKYKYFNTNNIWLNLVAIKAELTKEGGFFLLPMIVNEKNIDPTDKESPLVYQLECAMGSAISIFKNAEAICVERDRFIPIKKTSDILILRSDLYKLNSSFELECQLDSPLNIPEIKLDDHFYKFMNDLEERFPFGSPSLKDATKFSLTGDFKFGKNVKVEGNVELTNNSNEQINIADNTVLDNS